MHIDFGGKVVLVSGGSRPGGISRKIVKGFGEWNASVVWIDRDPEGGYELESELTKQGGRCRFVQGDVCSEKDAAHAVQVALEFGPLSILVNAVGGSQRHWGTTTVATTSQHYEEAFRLNFLMLPSSHKPPCRPCADHRRQSHRDDRLDQLAVPLVRGAALRRCEGRPGCSCKTGRGREWSLRDSMQRHQSRRVSKRPLRYLGRPVQESGC